MLYTTSFTESIIEAIILGKSRRYLMRNHYPLIILIDKSNLRGIHSHLKCMLITLVPWVVTMTGRLLVGLSWIQFHSMRSLADIMLESRCLILIFIVRLLII
jgi:hypothetical protein